jgi:hypothetical protein
MRSGELIAQIQRADPAGMAHVEVLEHEGSWAWVVEASLLTLSDSEGVTQTVVLHVSNSGLRQKSQPIGLPAYAAPVSHVPTVQDWAEMKERKNRHDQEDSAE